MQKLDDWMGELFTRILNGPEARTKSVRLHELALPGTHHSTITEVRGWGKFISSLAVCQSSTIKQQFQNGVRFFHLALGDDCQPGVIFAKHYFPAKPIHKELMDLLECLHSHPKQFVILYIKKDYDSNLSQQGVNKLTEMVLETFASVGIIPSSRQDDNVLDWYRKGKLPGQVILAGMNRLAHGIKDKLIWNCDNSYHQTQSDSPDLLIERMLDFTSRQTWPATKLMNYECIITLSTCRVLSFSSILKETKALQDVFSVLLEDFKFAERCNIVMVDFITFDQAKSIARLNHQRFLD